MLRDGYDHRPSLLSGYRVAGVKALVLATASPPAVAAAVRRLQRRRPAAKVEVATTRLDDAVLRGKGLNTRLMGERFLALDRPTVRAELDAAAYDLVVVPVAFPRHPFRFVSRLARYLDGTVFEVSVGPLLLLRRPMAVRVALALVSFLLYPPVGLLMRLSRSVEGGVLLAVLLLARWRRPARRTEQTSDLVCHVITTLATGGAQRQVIDYIESSEVPTEKIVLIALDHCTQPEYLEAAAAAGLRVELLGQMAQASLVARLGSFFLPCTTWLVLLRRRLSMLRPRAVMAWLFLANVISAPAARLAGVPYFISSIRNLSAWKTWPRYRRWWYRAADRLSVPLNHLIVANSQAVAEDYARWSGAPEKMLRVVANGVHVQRLKGAAVVDVRARLGIAPHTPMLLSVGRLEEEKNFQAVIRAAAALCREGRPLAVVVVGEGELGAELEALVASLGLDKVVHMVGRSDEPHSFYAAADIFVLSSHIEGMPNVVLEAQLLAVPVVTTASGGSAEVVVDGETGIVVPVKDQEALETAIRRLLDEPELARRMGEQGAERILQRFTITHTAAALDNLINDFGQASEGRSR